MNVLPIPAFTDNYIWVVIDEQKKEFICIDPGEAQPVLDFAEEQQLTLRSILLTHHHHDHIGGVAQLIDAHGSCKVYGPNDPRIPFVTDVVHEGQKIKVAEHQFTILFNPGHTSSHISYYEAQHGWLFCGDTLFSAGCGRVFDGTMEQLHQSLLMFKGLPASTYLFCAHEYTRQNLAFAHSVEPSNQKISDYTLELSKDKTGCTLPSQLGLELAINPFLRTQITEVQQYAMQHGALSSESLEVFKVLREQKNIF